MVTGFTKHEEERGGGSGEAGTRERGRLLLVGGKPKEDLAETVRYLWFWSKDKGAGGFLKRDRDVTYCT